MNAPFQARAGLRDPFTAFVCDDATATASGRPRLGIRALPRHSSTSLTLGLSCACDVDAGSRSGAVAEPRGAGRGHGPLICVNKFFLLV